MSMAQIKAEEVVSSVFLRAKRRTKATPGEKVKGSNCEVVVEGR